MDGFLSIFTAFGLSSAAGLNAYLPLLVVALMARFTDLVHLEAPWDALQSGWVIAVLAVLLLVEMLVDKVPAVDSINDGLQTFVRPVAGAILFAASAGVIRDVHPALALICGLLVAGSVHAAKATARPVVTGTSGGLLNPLVSVAEDVVSFVITVLSILAPILGILLLLLIVIWFFRRRNRRRAASEPEW